MSVFILRVPPPGQGFRWEIRRFGNIVLRAGEDTYETPIAAQAAGEAARVRWSD